MMDIKTLLEDEIDILYTTLDRLKIYDIRLSHTKDGRIFAKDADSQWTGKNFYKFLLNDAIVYNQDGTSSVLTEHTLTSLRQLGKHYGAAFPFMELEENPIKYAEMSMEQNYNMIDGIINNISVQEETAKKEEPVTANEVLKQKSETPLLRVVPVNRFERYIEPGEITQDQYIVKGGILLTPCASNPDFYESSNRRVNGSYIDAHIYEVAEQSKRGKPTAFRVVEDAPVENPFEPVGKEIALTQSGGIPCGLVYKHEMEGFILADKTVLLQKERDAHGNYYGGISLDGMMFKIPKMYAPVTDETGRITAFRQMREKDFSRGQPQFGEVMPMRLTKYEQETIILFNESESTAAVYTYNTGLQNTLNSLYQSHPEQVTQTGDNGYGGLTYSLPKKWVKIAPPRVLSEAQKKVLEDMNRKNKERRQ